MIRRLSLNEMDLQRSKQMLALLQRQPDHLRRVFGHGRATADLVNANDPIRSDQLQHDPPLHPELPATTTGRPHSTPTFWTVSPSRPLLAGTFTSNRIFNSNSRMEDSPHN
jgi:hypothetical protein